MGVIRRCGRTVVFSDIAQVPRFGRDSRFPLAKILVALCANFGVAQQTVAFHSSIADCSLHKLLRIRSLGRVLCGTLRFVKSGGLELQLQLYSSVCLIWAKWSQ